MTKQAHGRVGRFVIGALAAAAVWAGRRFRRFEVVGESMRPTLAPGDRILVWRTRRVRPGQLIALSEAVFSRCVIVKRVEAVAADGRVTVRGDNRDVSVDSRTYGPLRPETVLGRVVYRYAPPARAGWLSSGATRW